MGADQLREIDRLQNQLVRLRVLAHAISNIIDYEGNEIYRCVCLHGGPKQRRTLSDLYDAILWLRKETLDFPVILQEMYTSDNDTE